MPAMLQRLRSTCIRSLVLLSYALVVVAGLLSSVVVHGDFQVLCLGNGGMKLIAVDDNGDQEPPSTETERPMHCPLSQATVSPVYLAAPAAPPSALEYATRPAVVARLIALAGAPLPPRGPPRA